MLAGCATAPHVESAPWLPEAIGSPTTAESRDAPDAVSHAPRAARPASFAPVLVQDEPQVPKLEPYKNLYREFGLSIGGAAYQNFDSVLRVDSDSLVGAVLDLEDTLGVDDAATVLRVDAFYNFNQSHGLGLGYYDIRRSGSRVLDEDVTFGDRTFLAGSRVDTEFNTKVLKLAYRYNFVTDYRTKIGTSIGFHTMGIQTSLNAATLSVDESFRATVPLPVLGLYFEYALSQTWKLLSSVEVLQVDVGYARGYLSDTRLNLEHDLFENFGWGIGYNAFRLDATMEGEDRLTGRVQYDFQGLMLFARCYF